MKSKKQKLIFIIMVLALICCNNKNEQQINANQNNQNKAEEDMGYISKLNENVKREKVKYKNRYGLDIVADLYYEKDIDKTKKYPAIIVGAPYGGVKEQGPCIYGNELALRGFIVLAFDQSFMGESGGFPRNVSSPDIFVENFSASVDYLGLQEFVDREKIGVIGICGSAGFSLSAAQTDTRIKAITVVSGGDVSASRDFLSKEDLQKAKERLSLQRWVDAENGYPEYIPFFPEEPLEEVPANLEEPMSVWFRFYGLKRGHHTNALGGFTTTSGLSMMNFRLLDFIDEISPRPILFVIGDRAHSRSSSEGIYKVAAEPKEIYIVEDAEHIDLYDRIDRIPFDKLENFFKTNLK